MKTLSSSLHRTGALLAINLLFLMVWGFAGFDKIKNGVPSWFGDKFGATFLAKFPGLTATFWMLAVSEMLGFIVALIALCRGEFLCRRPPTILSLMLVWSLFIFIQLSLGQWLTSEYNATFQLFTYFGITLLSLKFVAPDSASSSTEPKQKSP